MQELCAQYQNLITFAELRLPGLWLEQGQNQLLRQAQNFAQLK